MKNAKDNVHILLIENREQLGISTFNFLLNELPENLRVEILKYQRWQDRQATLLGKILLIKGLMITKKYTNSIFSIQKDAFKRPFLEDLKMEFDFNITHSDGIVVCALSHNRVGIDVEMIDTIIINEYKSVFTKHEFEQIQTCSNEEKKVATFFKYWTRKEAIMKADGRGFYLSPTSFEAIDEEVIIDTQKWYLQAIDVNEILKTKTPLSYSNHSYSCHLATKKPSTIQTYLFDIKALKKN